MEKPKAEEARTTEQRVQNRIDAINRERQGYHDLMQQPANALLLTQAAALNQLFDEKTFSWTLAMEDLETVLPGGVQVTALEPVRDPDGALRVPLWTGLGIGIEPDAAVLEKFCRQRATIAP